MFPRLVRVEEAAAHRVLCDTTGVGEPVYESLSLEGCWVDPYPFTNRSKNDIINNLAVMLEKGLIQTLNPDTSAGATSEQILNSLIIGLRKGSANGEYRAVGIFALVEMRKPEGEGTFSAVHVGLEHREGYCVDVYYPVKLRGDAVVLDDPVAGKRSGTFFNSCH